MVKCTESRIILLHVLMDGCELKVKLSFSELLEKSLIKVPLFFNKIIMIVNHQFKMLVGTNIIVLFMFGFQQLVPA